MLLHGIDIQVHLYFPDNGYKLTMETPFVLVQGLLGIPSMGHVGSQPLIMINIMSSSSSSTGKHQSISFLPAHNNVCICPNATTGGGRRNTLYTRSLSGLDNLDSSGPGARRRQSTSSPFLLLHSAPAVTTIS